jgi:hypothetical protein
MFICYVLPMYRLSGDDDHDKFYEIRGCTPAHLLCMQKETNMSMVRFFYIRDPKSFLLCLIELEVFIHCCKLMKVIHLDYQDIGPNFKPLGMLCMRSEFLTFHDLVACLIAVDSTAEVICNGFEQFLRS